MLTSSRDCIPTRDRFDRSGGPRRTGRRPRTSDSCEPLCVSVRRIFAKRVSSQPVLPPDRESVLQPASETDRPDFRVAINFVHQPMIRYRRRLIRRHAFLAKSDSAIVAARHVRRTGKARPLPRSRPAPDQATGDTSGSHDCPTSRNDSFGKRSSLAEVETLRVGAFRISKGEHARKRGTISRRKIFVGVPALAGLHVCRSA